jgi:hypothetical protein
MSDRREQITVQDTPTPTHRQLAALSGRHTACDAAFSVRRGVFIYACALSPNTTICISHGNTMCVWRVFRILVKCFSGEKVWSAALVRLSAFAVRGAVNFTCAAVFFTHTERAAIFCACGTTDGSSKFW